MIISTYTFLPLVVIFVVNSSLIHLAKALDCMQPYCLCVDNTWLRCNNFTRFDQLNFSRVNGHLFETVEIRSFFRKLDLDEKLQLNGLKLNGRLSLSNIESVAFNYNPFRQILYQTLSLSIFDSNFKFNYTTGFNDPIGLNILKKCEYAQTADKIDFVFSDLNLNELVLTNIFFNEPLCPLFFRNSTIKTFGIYDPMGAFGFKQLTTIPSLSQLDLQQIINVYVQRVEFSYANNSIQPQWIDAQAILNSNMFEYLQQVSLKSARNLAYIQEKTFQLLPNTRMLELKNVKIKELLTRNRLWLKNLNYLMQTYDIDANNLNISMASNIFQLLIWVDDDWAFNDDKDICLFKNFPHNRLVFPFLLFPKPTLPCTCTIYWLYKYFSKYQAIYNLNQNIVPFHCFEKPSWDKCQFEALFNQYCTNSDPDESYTTLKPSAEITLASSTFSSLSPASSSGSTASISASTSKPDSTSIKLSTNQPPRPQNSQPSTITLVAFYLAISLSVLAAFIIALLVILFYKVIKIDKLSAQKRPKPQASTYLIENEFPEIFI
jgi:hypothetical protein